MGRVRSIGPGAGLGFALLGAFVGLLILPGPGLPTVGPASSVSSSVPGLPVGHGPHLARELAAASPRPAAPSLASNGADPSAIALTWTASTALLGFSGYTVYESTNGSSGPWTTAASISSQSTNYAVITSLTPGATYWWLESTGNVLSAAQDSNVLEATQPTLAYLTVTQPTSATAVLNWTNNATYGGPIGFVSYQVLEKIGGGAWFATANQTNESVLTANLSGLVSSSSYAFYVNTTDCVLGCGSATPQTVVTESNVVTAGTPGPLVVTMGVERAVVDAGQSDYVLCTPSGGRSPYAFDWRFAINGTFAPGPAAQSVRFASPSSPIITCHVRDAGASQANASATVLVNPTPKLTVTLNRTAADAGQSVGYTCVPSGGTQPLTVSWSFGDGTGVLQANASHAYASAGSFAAVCTLLDGAAFSIVNTSGVTVVPPPVAVLSISAATAAPDTALGFSVSFLNGSAPFTGVQVNFGDGTVGSGGGLSHAFHLVGNYSVVGRGKDANGIAARTVSVVHIVALTLSFFDPSATLTQGSAYAFSASAGGGAGGPYNYSWTLGDGTHLSGAAISHKYSATGKFTLSVRATDRLGASVVRVVVISVTAPSVAPSIFSDPWLLLIPAAVIGTTVDLLALRRYRAAESRTVSGSAQYVLPTDPERTLSGVRKCRNCGTANSAVRETCATCGATLSRGLFG